MKLLFLFLFLSCSLLASKELLKLSDRTLLIDSHGRGLIYPYNKYVCERPDRWFNKKCKWVRMEEIYNLEDEKIRNKLINLEFQCSSKHKYNY